jgi:hypothetical protein
MNNTENNTETTGPRTNSGAPCTCARTMMWGCTCEQTSDEADEAARQFARDHR